MAIEDEIVHWKKDEHGNQKAMFLRIDSAPPELYNGFPRDGCIFIKLSNGERINTMRLSVDEALRLSTQLLNIGRELLNNKRRMWNSFEPFKVNEKEAPALTLEP